MIVTKKTEKIIFLVLLVLLVGYGIYENTKKYNLLSEKGKIIQATIISFDYIYNGTCKIEYKFLINGTEYKSTERTSYFRCENNVPGCVGEKFKVIYLPTNPNINQLLLGKYEKYKHVSPRM